MLLHSAAEWPHLPPTQVGALCVSVCERPCVCAFAFVAVSYTKKTSERGKKSKVSLVPSVLLFGREEGGEN